MYNFNAITEDQEKVAVAKFKEYGKGIVMGKYIATLADENSAKWNDLVDEKKYSVQAIKTKMKEIARSINTEVNDEFLGDTSTAFTVRDHKNKEVKFTFVDMYMFLRGALRFRKETAEYKLKVKKYNEAKAYLNENKSAEDKMKEAAALMAELEKDL